MLIQNHTMVTLDEHDVRQAALNGGTPIDLPPLTTRVVLRVAPEVVGEPKKIDANKGGS